MATIAAIETFEMPLTNDLTGFRTSNEKVCLEVLLELRQDDSTISTRLLAATSGIDAHAASVTIAGFNDEGLVETAERGWRLTPAGANAAARLL